MQTLAVYVLSNVNKHMQGPQVQQKENDDAYIFQNYFSHFLFDELQNRNERQLLLIFSLTCKINKAQSAGKQAVKQYPP